MPRSFLSRSGSMIGHESVRASMPWGGMPVDSSPRRAGSSYWDSTEPFPAWETTASLGAAGSRNPAPTSASRAVCRRECPARRLPHDRLRRSVRSSRLRSLRPHQPSARHELDPACARLSHRRRPCRHERPPGARSRPEGGCASLEVEPEPEADHGVAVGQRLNPRHNP